MRSFPKAVIAIALLLVPLAAGAQFRKEAFTQSYNDKNSERKDTVDKLFSFKEYFGGLAHKNEIKVGTMAAGSAVFIGGCQIYNRDYWKLPIVYGGIGAGIGLGIHFSSRFKATDENRFKTASTLSFVGAGLVYWGSLMDGVIRYKPDAKPHPGKASLYSILVPGLGQAYNGEYWKIPIYWGGIIGSVHFWVENNGSYSHWRNIYLKACEKGYDGPYTKEYAVNRRDYYRRLRDYSIVATFGFYLLQIIDANVFAYMHDFNVSDELTMSVSPALISPDTRLACIDGNSALGLRLGFKF